MSHWFKISSRIYSPFIGVPQGSIVSLLSFHPHAELRNSVQRHVVKFWHHLLSAFFLMFTDILLYVIGVEWPLSTLYQNIFLLLAGHFRCHLVAHTAEVVVLICLLFRTPPDYVIRRCFWHISREIFILGKAEESLTPFMHIYLSNWNQRKQTENMY